MNIGSTQPLITQKSLKIVNVIMADEKILFKFEKISNIFFNKFILIKKLQRLEYILLPKLMSSKN